jgi:RND superfamily putative drug exporter
MERYVSGTIFVDEQANKQNEAGLKKGIIIAVIAATIIALLVTRKLFVVLSVYVMTVLNFIVSASIYSLFVDNGTLPITNVTPLALGIGSFLLSILSVFGLYYRAASIFSANKSNEASFILALQEKHYSLLVSHLVFAALSFGLTFTTFQITKSLSVLAVLGVVSYLISVTFLPALFSIFGKLLSFPGAKSSTFAGWQKWNSAITKRGGIFVLIAFVVAAPLVGFYKQAVAYSTADGLPNTDAAKGSRVIANEFGEGVTTPLKIVIENSNGWNSVAGMTSIEALSRSLSHIDGVKSIRSATRPFSSELDPLMLVSQATTLKDGLGKGNDGVNQIREGLQGAKDQLESNAPKLKQATDGIDQLINGTTKLQTGMGKLEGGLSQIEAGLRKGSVGAKQLHDGLGIAKDSTKKLLAGSKQLLAGYQTIESNFSLLTSGVAEIKSNLAKIQRIVQGSQELTSGIGQKYPNVASDQLYLQLQGTLTLLNSSLTAFISKVGEAEKGASLLSAGLKKANGGMKQVVDGQTALIAGLTKLYVGMGQLQNGITRAADGESLVLSNIPKVTDGLGQLKGGQTQLGDGIGLFVDKVGELQDGLGKAVGGLTQIHDGLNNAQGYLTNLSKSVNPSLAGWYLPEEALSKPEFNKIYDNYMSEDRNVTFVYVTFDKSPLSNKGATLVDQVYKTTNKSLEDQGITNAKTAVSDDPATVYSLKPIISKDIKWLLEYSLIVAFLLLALAYRNVYFAIITVVGAGLAYVVGLAASEEIFMDQYGQIGLKFLVPVFTLNLVFTLSCSVLAQLYKTNHEEPAQFFASNIASMFAVSMTVLATFVGLLFSESYLFVQVALASTVGLVALGLCIIPILYPIFAKKLLNDSVEETVHSNPAITIEN